MKKYTIGFTLTLLTLVLHTSTFAQCVAGFEVLTENGLEITFNNESIDASLPPNTLPDVEWIFGDGSAASTDYDVVHTFPGQGTYEVCVYITGPNCTDTYCLDVIVSGTVSCESYEIEVSTNVNGAVGIAGSIYNVTDFGPYEPDVVEWYIQELGVTVSTSPTFAESFPPNVDPFLDYTLCVDYEVEGLLCSGLCAPLIATPDSCEYEMSVEFYYVANQTAFMQLIPLNGSPQPDITVWSVDGIGQIGTDAQFNYEFPDVGPYTVCVAYEVSGTSCAGSMCQEVISGVNADSCEYVINTTINDLTVIMELESLNGEPSPDVIEWIIDGGIGQIGIGSPFTYEFPAGGTYTLCAEYEISGTNCSGFVCEDIQLVNGTDCEVGFEYEINNNTGVFEIVCSDVPEIICSDVAWTVGNDTVGFGSPFTYTLPPMDSFELCMTAEVLDITTGVLCLADTCQLVEVVGVNCAFALDIDVNGMTASGELLPAPDSDYPDTITWILEGGGGVIGTGNDFNYTFSNPGNYEICAVYNGICDGWLCDSFTIGTSCDFDIDYTLNNGMFDAGLSSPNNEPLPTVTAWTIQGTGQVIGSGETVNYPFLSEGTYTICADYEATADSPCDGQVCEAIAVLLDVCVVGFDYSLNTNDLSGVFEVVPMGPPFSETSHENPQWSIDGMSVGTGTPFDYTFPASGFYEVCLLVDIIGVNGFVCQADTCQTIQVGNICEDLEFATNINGQVGIFEVIQPPSFPGFVWNNPTWYIDNDSIEAVEIFDYQFPGTGAYEVCLTADLYDFEGLFYCSQESCETIQITNDCIELEFTSNLNGQVGIFELIPTSANVLEWINPVWYIDNDSIEAANIFDYQFPGAGLYDVCLTADLVDLGLNFICDQETCLTIEIEGGNNLCEAYFEWEEITGGSGYEVLFENGSTGNYTEAIWDFGNGDFEVTTSNLVDYTYNNPGVYNVCLTIGDPATGCQDSYCELVFVSGQPNCNYDITYTSSGTTFDFIISDPAGGYPAVAEWYNGSDNTSYGSGNDITITLTGVGVHEVCVDYANSGTACMGTICETITINDPNCTNTDCVFPGDANYDYAANNFDVLPVGLEFGATGDPRLNASTAWYGQYAQDWTGTTADGINQKHVDCDGDGLIDFPDIDAIQLNYNRTHDGIMPTNFVEVPEIWLDFDLDTIFADMMSGNTIVVEADIMVATDAMPAEDIYGLAFSINYPSALVVEGSAEGEYYTNSWLGDGSTTLQLEQDVYQQGMIDFGYSRTDLQNVSGFGQVGAVRFVMTDNIIGSLGRSVEEVETLLNFYVTDIRVVNNLGEAQGFSGSHGQVHVISETTNAVINPDLSEFISVYPNPASQILHIQTEKVNTERIILYDAFGKTILDQNTSGNHEQLDVADLPTGVYFLSIYTGEGILNEKLVIE